MVEKPAVQSNDLLIRSKGVASRFIDDQVILVRFDSAHPFRLNELGARIWGLLEHPSKVEEMIDQVRTLYDVRREEVFPDMVAFLSELLENRLIETVRSA